MRALQTRAFALQSTPNVHTHTRTDHNHRQHRRRKENIIFHSIRLQAPRTNAVANGGANCVSALSDWSAAGGKMRNPFRDGFLVFPLALSMCHPETAWKTRRLIFIWAEITMWSRISLWMRPRCSPVWGWERCRLCLCTNVCTCTIRHLRVGISTISTKHTTFRRSASRVTWQFNRHSNLDGRGGRHWRCQAFFSHVSSTLT